MKEQNRFYSVLSGLDKFVKEHPLAMLFLLSLVAIVVWVVVVPGEGEETQPKNQTSSSTKTKKSEEDGQETQMPSSEEESALRGSQNYAASARALYELPYLGRSIRAYYVRTEEGPLGLRYVVWVGHFLSKEKGVEEWEEFLSRYGDSGDSYIVKWQSLPH